MRGHDKLVEEFTEFFAGRFDTARRTAYALCGDWSEAEEIAQAAFVRIYARWAKIRRDDAPGYLRVTLTRVFLDSRRRGRQLEKPVAEPPDRPGVEKRGHDERQELISALQRVPPRQRATLVLRFVQDLSIEQTAQVLKCSKGTVKSQTARGLDALRRAYESVGRPQEAGIQQ
ncbi:SigE family RNA polymerase sigma factor [Actinoalloteichus hymeniacidonis]|uniref:RNA polymerase sigma-70 factor, sigma-E family n=1 Tax=Actinoalloteichus hymeniacidonis TaxID=340345 RepID=A0AAC9HKB0_9PSEU|nr:SigE family RNA polymerase sigma factor [Actinoalloteichus hymeniacidonis]AOS60923.1 RNA polymerase sigma-70 factor, sigma-E family [Actinoalloteichus hymeniacidonis]MBB5911077.1 RNA polymerase sigma-70 factor (sigma-E family) [Actinoalloteichus hymeniacidonis]